MLIKKISRRLLLGSKKQLRELSEKLQVEIAISVGVAVYPDDTRNLDELITIADSSMYSLKNQNKPLYFQCPGL